MNAAASNSLRSRSNRPCSIITASQPSIIFFGASTATLNSSYCASGFSNCASAFNHCSGSVSRSTKLCCSCLTLRFWISCAGSELFFPARRDSGARIAVISRDRAGLPSICLDRVKTRAAKPIGQECNAAAACEVDLAGLAKIALERVEK